MTQRRSLTAADIQKLTAELEYLRAELPRIAEDIQQALELGDPSENAEYDAAKEEEARYLARIEAIGKLLRDAGNSD